MTATYVMNFDGDSIMDAFKNESGDPLKQIVRDTPRKLVSAHLIKSNDPLSRMVTIGFANRYGVDSDVFYKEGFTAFRNASRSVQIPDWFPKGPRDEPIPARAAERELLLTFYKIEKCAADRLARLDALVDATRSQRVPVDESKLEDAARKFVEEAVDLDDFGSGNTFFGVFDALIEIGSNGKAHRESTLILQIAAPGGREEVTKCLTAS